MSMMKTAPTIADLAHHIETCPTSDLTPARRKRIAGDIRLIARWCGRTPEEMPARLRDLRPLVDDLHHARIGISRGRLANAKSSLRRALEALGAMDTRPAAKRADELPSAWRHLFAMLKSDGPAWIAPRLGQFARFCAEAGIAPDAVGSDVFDAWGDWRERGSGCLAADPRHAVRQAIYAWNRAVAVVEGWPQHPIGIASKRKTVTIPLADFPATFRADIDALVTRMTTPPAGKGPGFLVRKDRKPPKGLAPLSATTVRHRVEHIHLAATALVLAGAVPIEAIGAVADVVTPEAARLTLQQMYVRHGYLTEYALTVAKSLYNTARRLAQYGMAPLSDEAEAEWRDLLSEDELRGLSTTGLTTKNRERLTQFSSDANISAVLSLPFLTFDRLEAERKRRGCVTVPMARDAETAVALLLLQMLPLRVQNLATVVLGKNLRAPVGKDDRATLNFARDEVKGRQPIGCVISDDKWRLIDLYRRHYRPRLCDPTRNDHLFPARDGDGHLDIRHMASKVSTAVYRETGITMNAHLWRHFIASLYLRRNPKAFELVRALLGHSEKSTATRRYAELATAMAAEEADRLMEEHRQRSRKTPKRKVTRRWN